MFKKRSGQTLIEVLVAVMLSAITATAVFSVILSTKYSYAKADKREAAAVAMRSAQEYLKPFISADPYASYSSAFMPTKNIYGESSWALATGDHNITFLLGNMPQLTGSNASLYSFLYTVTDDHCGSGSATTSMCKRVVFSLTYPVE